MLVVDTFFNQFMHSLGIMTLVFLYSAMLFKLQYDSIPLYKPSCYLDLQYLIKSNQVSSRSL